MKKNSVLFLIILNILFIESAFGFCLFGFGNTCSEKPAETLFDSAHQNPYIENYVDTFQENYEKHFSINKEKNINRVQEGHSILEALAQFDTIANDILNSNIDYFYTVTYACKDRQLRLSRSLENYILEKLKVIASSALVLHLEQIMKSHLKELIEPVSREDIKNTNMVIYDYSKDKHHPQIIKLVGDESSESSSMNLFGHDSEEKEMIVSKLNTDIRDIMILASIANVSLENRDLGLVLIEASDGFSIKKIKVGRLYVNAYGSGKMVDIEAEDVLWIADSVGTNFDIKNMKAKRINISLSGTGSSFNINKLTSESTNIHLNGTGTETYLNGITSKNFNYINTGTGSFTRIKNSVFQSMRLFNKGTLGPIHLFDVMAHTAFIVNMATMADIFMDNVKGDQILIAHSDGTGADVVGNQLTYPVIQISNSSTGTGGVLFLNKVHSDLLIICNTNDSTSTSKELTLYADNCRESNTCVADILFKKMHTGGNYTTDINELDTKVFIVLDDHDRRVKAKGKTDILIAPKGMPVEGLEYNQRIDFDTNKVTKN